MPTRAIKKGIDDYKTKKARKPVEKPKARKPVKKKSGLAKMVNGNWRKSK